MTGTFVTLLAHRRPSDCRSFTQVASKGGETGLFTNNVWDTPTELRTVSLHAGRGSVTAGRWKLGAETRKFAGYADTEAGCVGKVSGRHTSDLTQHAAFMDRTLEATQRWYEGTPLELQPMQLRGKVAEKSQPVRSMCHSNR